MNTLRNIAKKFDNSDKTFASNVRSKKIEVMMEYEANKAQREASGDTDDQIIEGDSLD